MSLYPELPTEDVVGFPARKLSMVPRYVTDRYAASPGSAVRNTLVQVFAQPYAVFVPVESLLSREFTSKTLGRSPAAETTSWTAASEVRTSWLAHWFVSETHLRCRPS